MTHQRAPGVRESELRGQPHGSLVDNFLLVACCYQAVSTGIGRLIEICGVSGTLIADEGAVYNLREPNDRLLLGVKGTLSEAELFTLRTRLYEGRWNKARKRAAAFSLAGGLCTNGDEQLDTGPGHPGS